MALLALLLLLLGVSQNLALRQQLIDGRVTTLQNDLTASREALGRSGGRRTATVAPLTTAVVARSLCLQPAAQTRTAIAAYSNAVAATSGRTVAVIIYDRGLRVAAANPASPDQPRLDPAALQRALSGSRSMPEVVAGTDGDQLLVGFPVKTPSGQTCGVAQLSTPMTPIADAIAAQQRTYLLGALVALLLALLIGLILTGGALRPLRRLTRTAGRLAEGDLRARSQVEPRADEVGVLAHAFDDMAGRIEEAFAAQALALTAQRESEDRTRRFIADASHELRTPVTALKGYIDVIRRGAVQDPGALDAALEAMAREAERLRVLVLDLLTLARIDSPAELHSEPLDLTATAGQVLDEGVPGMPPELHREFAKESPVLVMADHNALVAIIRNLLTNACKYAPGAAQTWSVDRDPDHGRLRVHDEGPGVPAADIPHLFDRFYRGEKTRAREEGGTGLGLSIVRGLVQAQGGSVAFDSIEGQGATVTVTLPIAAD